MHSYSLNLCSCEKKPEKNRGLAGINLTAIPMQGSNQFARQAVPRNWELIIKLFQACWDLLFQSAVTTYEIHIFIIS